MRLNKGQGLVEYALILLMCAVVVIVIFALFVGIAQQTSCTKSDPNAGDIVSCIATRTAEARHK